MANLRCTLSPLLLSSSPSLLTKHVLNSYFGEGQVLSWFLGKGTWSSSCPLFWPTPLRHALSFLVLTFHHASIASLQPIPAFCIFLVESKPRLLRTYRLVPSHFCSHVSAMETLDGFCPNLGEDSMRLPTYTFPSHCYSAAQGHAGSQVTWSLGHGPGRARHKCLLLLELFSIYLQFQWLIPPLP